MSSHESSFEGLSGVLHNAYVVARGSYNEIVEKFEDARSSFERWSSEKLPEPYAYLAMRISRAVPEVFAGLGAIFGGIFILPSLIASWYMMRPLSHIAKCLLHGEFSTEQLVAAAKRTWADFEEEFQNSLVPAVFVALSVDAVVSLTIGYLTMDFGRVLHATTVAGPGAILACVYLMGQKGGRFGGTSAKVGSE
jgi:hypothetical protein